MARGSACVDGGGSGSSVGKMERLSFLRRHWFLVGLVAVIALAKLAPGLGRTGGAPFLICFAQLSLSPSA